MTSGLVNASFSWPEWQAVKMIFLAPCLNRKKKMTVLYVLACEYSHISKLSVLRDFFLRDITVLVPQQFYTDVR